MQVDIRQLPALRVAAVRHVGPYDQIGKAFEQLSRIAGSAGLIRPPESEMIALYYDDPGSTPPEKLTSDAGVTVPEGATLPSGLAEQRVPAGTYACTVFTGPYDRLPDAWNELVGEWLHTSGRRMSSSAPSCEVYLNDPSTTPASALRTELRLALE